MFKNMRVGMKIFVGFGLVLGLLALVSGVGYWGLGNSSEKFNHYREMAMDTNLAGRLQANMLMVRMNVKDYILKGSDKDLQAFTAYWEKMEDFLNEAKAEINEPNRVANIDHVAKILGEYKQGFAQVQQLREQRNHAVDEVLNVNGPAMEKALTEIMVSAERDRDPSAAFEAGIALKHLLLGRLYMAKFLDTNSPQDAARANKEFETLKGQLVALDQQLNNANRRRLLAQVKNLEQSYASTFGELVRIINDRNQIISGTLDRIGPDVAKRIEDVKLDIKSVQDILGPELVAVNERNIWLIGSMSLIALALGAVFAFMINRAITNPVVSITAAADAMAKGDLNQKVMLNQADELGKLANAFNAMTTAIREKQEEIQKTLDMASDVVAEVNEASEELKKGNLSKRAKVGSATGGFKLMVEGFNASLNAVIDPVNEALEVLEKVAERDMSVRVVGNYQGDHARIKDALNQAVRNLDEGLAQVNVASEQVSAASGQISAGSQSLAEGASEQASSLEEISSSLEEMSSMTRQNADSSSQAKTLAQSALSSAEKGNEAMREMKGTIDKIKSTSDETAKIVITIDEIAFQTNLLALNAAVEAARAGEAGKGFAVVAEEVRNLAQRSAEASRTTADLIEGSVRSADDGVRMTEMVANLLDEIATGARKVSDLVGDIASASGEQSQGIDQLNLAVTDLDKVTQLNAANAEESASAAEELNGQSEEMRSLVGQFMLSNAKSPQNFLSKVNVPVLPKSHKVAKDMPVLALKGGENGMHYKNGKNGNSKKHANQEALIPLDSDDGFEDF